MKNRFDTLPNYRYYNNYDGNIKKALNKPLRDYIIEGNSIQDGTPTFDNPIKINSCGDYDDITKLYQITIINQNGKNLFDKNNVFWFLGYCGPSAIIAHAKARTILVPCEPNTTYSVSKNVATSQFHFGCCDTLPSFSVNNSGEYVAVGGDPVTVHKTPNNSTDWDLTLTTTENSKYLLIYACNGWVADDVAAWDELLNTLQVEKNSIATEYEEYKADNYLINLNEPLRKVDNYVDTIDFKSKTLVKRVQYVNFSELEWTYNEGMFSATLLKECYNNFGLCNRFLIGTEILLNNNIINVVFAQITSLEEWDEYIHSNDCYVLYTIQDEIINIELPKIQMVKGSNLLKVSTEILPSSLTWVYYK